MKKHPTQPIALDENGTPRFVANPIVRYLLDAGGIDMNRIALLPVDDEDRAHFAQLIGYSVSGWGDLSYVRPEDAGRADEVVRKLLAKRTKKRTP